jgi:SRSO17 transposase
LPAKKRQSARRRPGTRLRRNRKHRPLSVKALALRQPKSVWQTISWREGTAAPLASRFACLRVRPAHRDEKLTEPRPEEWLLIEWPRSADTRCNLPGKRFATCLLPQPS